jgi:hypothetical protein
MQYKCTHLAIIEYLYIIISYYYCYSLGDKTIAHWTLQILC